MAHSLVCHSRAGGNPGWLVTYSELVILDPRLRAGMTFKGRGLYDEKNLLKIVIIYFMNP
jgi:hypothetical protein